VTESAASNVPQISVKRNFEKPPGCMLVIMLPALHGIHDGILPNGKIKGKAGNIAICFS
jgi:hypothetical protein